MKLKEAAFSVKTERAILFKVVLYGDKSCEENPLEELQRLAETAGAKVIHKVIQKRIDKDPLYYIGKGKISELSHAARELNADILICDEDLTPAQVKNLEKILNKNVIDRSELILDIFATRAKTHQAKLQVELAQLEYTKPRLKRMWTHLSRIEGGIGTRGPGEKQLEVDNRIVSRKIQDLKQKLREIEKRQHRLVRSRKECFTVSIVGYTNAGKSTLMNALTNIGTFVEDKLFATLDTKTSICKLGAAQKILISDTVGFIQNLPHHLVFSFKATLEEARHADLLLHVVDTSSPDALKQIEAVDIVLKELGCEKTPTLMLFNKIDAVKDLSIVPLLQNRYRDSIMISAKTRQGLQEVKEKIAAVLERNFVEIELSCNQSSGKLIAYLHEHARILSNTFVEQKALYRLLIDERLLQKLHMLDNDIQIKGTAGRIKNEIQK
ncbi:MAG: GTPase HflX [Candidatus Brocadiaceae bacterium]|nr:GTPase HflX [Candidatus Brocadiaceae bacterium]